MLLWLAGTVIAPACGDLQNLHDVAAPLARINVQVTGDLAAVVPDGVDPSSVALRATIVWAGVPSPDVFCLESTLEPPSDPAALAVSGAGCPDVLAFAPALVGPSVDVVLGQTFSIELMTLPSAEVLAGPPEGRVGYASVVVYRDVVPNGTLDLRWPSNGHNELSDGDGGGPGGNDVRAFSDSGAADQVYGASFVTMGAAHTRIAFREGAFDEDSFFYPMTGCEAPPVGFSVIDVSGSLSAATCVIHTLDATTIIVPLAAPSTVDEVRCADRPADNLSSTHEPDADQATACLSPTHLVAADPSLDADGFPTACKGVGHFLLKGCSTDAECDTPEWDVSADPPLWWPCASAAETP